MLKLKRENIPEEMKKERKWVVFEISPEGGKTPINPNAEKLGEAASITDPSTWGTFEQAASLVEKGVYPALGYAMTEEDKLIFVDVDFHEGKCSTKEEKEKLEMQYKSMCRTVETFGTYIEQSVSGTGVHLLARGVLSEDLARGQSKVMPVEIYDKSRFIIMTGHKLNDFDIEDNDRTLGGIHSLHKAYFQPVSPSKGLGEKNSLIPVSSTQLYSDEEVLEVAMKNKEFELLWNGQWEQIVDEKGNQKYSQQHYADFVLIRRLTFYTGNFPTQVERLFKKSPCYQQYGKNGKWSKYESDIRKDIQTASTTCYAVYNPNYKEEKVAVKTSDTDSEDVEVIDTQEWRPDFHKVWALLSDTDPETRVFKNPVLVALLKDYVVKYADKENIRYIPYLFKEDKNINGAANILQKVAGDTLKYSYKFGAYFIWDGKRYKNHGDPEVLIHPVTEILGMVEHSVFHWIMTYVAKTEDDADTDEEDTEDTKGKSKKKKSKKDLLEERAVNLIYQSKKYVSKTMAVDVLKKYKGMSVGDDLVTYYESPHINLQNGVLDLTTRELHPHNTKFNMSKITNCDYDPLAVCPTFESMVAKLIPDAAARKEMQKAFGLCLAKEHLPAKKIILLLVGPKDTGKTTLLNTVVDVLGEYGTSVDNSLLMQNTKDKTRGPEMYDFFETLMITTSENSEKDKLDASKIKALSGQTTQSIRNNYATKMDKFKMIGLIWIDSNFKPYLNPRDMAAWDRLRLFELPNPIKVKDVTLPQKLEAEKAGIFNWMLKGLDMVLEEKAIFETESMLACKEQYRKEMDTTEQFLQDCVVATDDKSMRIPTTLLYITYKNWVKDNNFHCTVRNKFYEEVGKVFEKKKSGNEFFVGIRFSELGELYSTMTEKTPTEFAKRKREILVGSKSGLPYRAVRAIHFQSTQGWFYMVNEFTDRTSYINYCSWCAEEGKVPIKVEDFEVKIDYLKKHLDSQKTIRRVLEDATEIWSD